MKTPYKNNRFLDRGDLTQLMIIVAGLAVAAIVVIGATASVLLNKGEAAAGCIAEAGSFESGKADKVRCEDYNETARQKSIAAMNGHFANASGNVIGEEYSEEESAMRKDLKIFYDKVEDFYKKNGKYPENNDLESFNYHVDLEKYPVDEYNWNFEYCRSLDNKEFIVTVFTGTDEVLYVSSNNKNPRKYSAKKEDLNKVVRNGEWTGGYVSPCYSGTSYSAADRAGLSKTGSINKEGNLVISGAGRSGMAHEQKTGFVYPHE